jgi:hypothetical protein
MNENIARLICVWYFCDVFLAWGIFINADLCRTNSVAVIANLLSKSRINSFICQFVQLRETLTAWYVVSYHYEWVCCR